MGNVVRLRPRKRMKARVRWTEERKALFLEKLAETGNVTRSAKAVQSTRNSAYGARDRDPAFAQRWTQAAASAADALEELLRERVVNGVPRKLVFQGQVVATVRDYSDRLAIFMLSRLRPAGYNVLAAEREAERPEDAICDRMRADTIALLRARGERDD